MSWNRLLALLPAGLAGNVEDPLCGVGLAEGRTDFLNGYIVHTGFVPVPASVAPLVAEGAASDELGTCGGDWLLAVQVLFGFRSFKKAVAVQGALEACARACRGARQDAPGSAEELCRLLGPYVAVMTDVEAVVAMAVALEHVLAEHVDVPDAAGMAMDAVAGFCSLCEFPVDERPRGSSPSVGCAFVLEAVGAVVA